MTVIAHGEVVTVVVGIVGPIVGVVGTLLVQAWRDRREAPMQRPAVCVDPQAISRGPIGNF